MTKTQDILRCNTPYGNISQGIQKKIVFVCSVGMLRSPTAATIGSKLGLNTRSCGSSTLALIPLSANLIRWADWIVFMKYENYKQSKKTFQETEFQDDLEEKSLAWDVPDIYNYMDDGLVQMLETQIKEFL